jgi:hypothetical protein
MRWDDINVISRDITVISHDINVISPDITVISTDIKRGHFKPPDRRFCPQKRTHESVKGEE